MFEGSGAANQCFLILKHDTFCKRQNLRAIYGLDFYEHAFATGDAACLPVKEIVPFFAE